MHDAKCTQFSLEISPCDGTKERVYIIYIWMCKQNCMLEFSPGVNKDFGMNFICQLQNHTV